MECAFRAVRLPALPDQEANSCWLWNVPELLSTHVYGTEPNHRGRDDRTTGATCARRLKSRKTPTGKPATGCAPASFLSAEQQDGQAPVHARRSAVGSRPGPRSPCSAWPAAFRPRLGCAQERERAALGVTPYTTSLELGR